MPAVILPQVLLCGLFVPREAMAGWLQAISDVMPMSYAVEALLRGGRQRGRHRHDVARPGHHRRLRRGRPRGRRGHPAAAHRLRRDGGTALARTGRRPGRQDTREAILAAARDAFAEKGFDGASIRYIATSAGVDPALVHHYFGTKDQLFLAAMDFPIDPARSSRRWPPAASTASASGWSACSSASGTRRPARPAWPCCAAPCATNWPPAAARVPHHPGHAAGARPSRPRPGRGAHPGQPGGQPDARAGDDALRHQAGAAGKRRRRTRSPPRSARRSSATSASRSSRSERGTAPVAEM